MVIYLSLFSEHHIEMMYKYKLRLFAKINRAPNETDCWLWIGASSKNGYGTVRDRNGKVTNCHRVVYCEMIGPISDKHDLDHLCRNPRCVNPAHLQPVTRKENLRRGNGAAASRARMIGNTMYGNIVLPRRLKLNS